MDLSFANTLRVCIWVKSANVGITEKVEMPEWEDDMRETVWAWL